MQQYKHERECNAVIAQTREEKIARLESLMDGMLPSEELMLAEYLSLKVEHKVFQFSIYFPISPNMYMFLLFYIYKKNQ